MNTGIGLAPGAEENSLAAWLAALLEENLRDDPRRQRDFSALRAAVAVVATDQRLSTTLRFDHGRVTLHDGMVGIPDITLCGEHADLVALTEAPVARFGTLSLPPLTSRRWRDVVARLMAGGLKIYGMVSHPRLLWRLLRVLCRR